MEKERNSKLIAIIALVVAVCGLSFGFAAFTKDLNIQFSESNVNVSGELDMKIYAYDNEIGDYDKTLKTVFPSNISDDSIVVEPLVISDDNVSINVGSITFNNVGQSVKYSLGIANESEYPAYIKSFDFLNYDNSDSFKVCTAVNGTDQSLVDQACEGIKVSINYGGGLINEDDVNFDGLNWKFSMSQKVNSVASLKVSITYEEDAVVPNGDFKVNFGSIKFSFSSVS